MTDQNILANIDSVIDALSTPVNASEISEGWTPESKKAIKTFFEGLKNMLLSGEDLPPMSISRALDHWGVISGEILEKSAQISNELRSGKKLK
jgi:hypothetical protein